jgi:hypothetical protein
MVMDTIFMASLLTGLWLPESLLLAAALASARTGVTLGKRRRSIAPANAFRPDRILKVACLLALADVGLWLGAVDWVRARAGSRMLPP